MNYYKILLADDQEMFRHGIKSLVCQVEDSHICGEACNGQELIELVDKSIPDLIIMEIDLPKLNELEILGEIKKNHPEVKILILSKRKERKFIYSAVSHGVDGFILKEEPSGELLRALDVIRNGGAFYSALLSSDLMSLIRTKKQAKPLLSKREKEILQHMAKDRKSPEIAKFLDISIHTVHRHRHNIKKKLKMKHMTELIKYCILNKDNL